MIVVVVPEPMAWVSPLCETLRETLPEDTVVFSLGAVHVAARAIGALWARAHTDRRMWTRFARRRLVDYVAARWLPRAARVVYAPSGGAELTFAVAKRRGCETVLVHDLPCMRELHEDLDEALRRYPDCAFLHRFRAPRAVLVRQEVERVLADRVMARDGYASALLLARGITRDRLMRLPEPPAAAAPVSSPAIRTRSALLLAGLAAARAGSNEALEVLARRPHLTLLVRGGAGEGLEPRRLLTHPQVRVATSRELEHLEAVDAVLAPAWCESHPPEVRLALARGVPVIGTLRAMGGLVPTRTVEPGDAHALGLAFDSVLRPPVDRHPGEPEWLNQAT